MKTGSKWLAAIAIFGMAAVLAAGCGGGGSQAKTEKFPTKPIEFIVPWGPGGGADQLARLVAKGAEGPLGVSLPVLNVPGASGVTGTKKMLAAPADGYKIMVLTSDTHATLSSANPGFKLEEITPVARMVNVASYLFVSYDSPYKTWADLEKAARANPDTLKAAVTGVGTLDDITLTVLEKNGIKFKQVPFPNPGERYVSILGGHADILYEQAGDVRQFLEQKQIRPILVFGEKRSAQFPDIPCSKEVNLPVYLKMSRSIVVKAGTDPQKIKVLTDALKKYYDTPEFKKHLDENYADPDSFAGAEETKKSLETDLALMKQVLGSK